MSSLWPYVQEIVHDLLADGAVGFQVLLVELAVDAP